MLVSDLITAINQYLRGIDDDVPSSGDDEYTYWLAVANRKQQEWARDGKQTWSSLFDIRSAGAVVAGTETYNLASDIVIPADRVFVTTTAGQDVDYEIVRPVDRDRITNGVYLSGSSPQQVTFTSEIAASDQIVGGTIYVAGYYLPTDLEDDADEILVDDPNWLALASAADIAFGDIIYEDKVEGLNIRANNLYTQMSNNNRRGTYRTPRRLQVTNSYRIHGPNRRSSRGI